MSKKGKRKDELNPTEIHLVDFPEPRPLFVRADQIGRVVIGWNSKTAANWRSAKTGPRYFMVGGKPYYRIDDLENYFGSSPIKTTGEP